MPRLLLVLGAALFSTGGAAIKGCSLGGWEVAALRSGIAALTLVAILPGARRRWRGRDLLVGVAYATTLTLFVLANKHTSAARTILLQAAAPLYLLLLGPWLLREHLRRADLAIVGVMGLGLVLVVLGEDRAVASASDGSLGTWLAAACGVSWAFTILGLRWTGRGTEDGNLVPPVVGNVLVFAVGLPLALTGDFALPQGTDLAILLWLGVFQIAIAYACVLAGLRHVGALETSLLLLVEPVLSPLWAWWFQGEEPGIGTLVGGGLILVGATVCGLRPRPTETTGPTTPEPSR